MIEIPGKYTTAKIMLEELEQECTSQIINFINNESFTEPVAIMPDTHAGKGCVIGFTMKLPKDLKVIPNIIGVDIGCGMLSSYISDPFSLLSPEQVNNKIRQVIPMGFAVHKHGKLPANLFKDARLAAKNFSLNA